MINGSLYKKYNATSIERAPVQSDVLSVLGKCPLSGNNLFMSLTKEEKLLTVMLFLQVPVS